jgi:hypothetical protein
MQLDKYVTVSCIFCDITPCSSLKVNQCFRGTCRLHLHGRSIIQGRIQSETRSKQGFLAWHILRPWSWRLHVLSKRLLTLNQLQGVISQKIEHFVTTAVRISNPTLLLDWSHQKRWDGQDIQNALEMWEIRIQFYLERIKGRNRLKDKDVSIG